MSYRHRWSYGDPELIETGEGVDAMRQRDGGRRKKRQTKKDRIAEHEHWTKGDEVIARSMWDHKEPLDKYLKRVRKEHRVLRERSHEWLRRFRARPGPDVLVLAPASPLALAAARSLAVDRLGLLVSDAGSEALATQDGVLELVGIVLVPREVGVTAESDLHYVDPHGAGIVVLVSEDPTEPRLAKYKAVNAVLAERRRDVLRPIGIGPATGSG